MDGMGQLESMARADLEALVAEIGREYSAGAIDALSASDPAWRRSLDRAERELGELYGVLREADGAVTRWRRAIGELQRLWALTRGDGRAFEDPTGGELADVA